MIGTLPVSERAPLDYRYALDAAASLLSNAGPSLVLCQANELVAEVRQRIPRWGTKESATAALWVEPRAKGWQAEVETLQNALPGGAPLVIVMSRPFAQIVLERRGWTQPALGLQVGGIERVRRALVRAGFTLEASHGIHSVAAMALNVIGQRCERLGRPELGDRLQFAARRRYRVTGFAEGLSTVALLVARQEVACVR